MTKRRDGARQGAGNPTRARILAAALDLFNQRGTAHVTTNHVAAAAGLSPGNLYYWFRNKGQIVAALVEEWLAEADRGMTEAYDEPAHVHVLWEEVGRSTDLDRCYAFVERELPALLHDDPALADAYRETYRRRASAHLAYARRLVASGVLQAPLPPRSLEDLVLAVQLVAASWPRHVELLADDKAGPAPDSVIRPLLVVLAPYLTEQGLRAFEAL
jgi:TetR/AcrR family transcriptional repressor of uid operon